VSVSRQTHRACTRAERAEERFMSHHMTRFGTRKRARTENQLRTAILDSMTHELRTFLTSIRASHQFAFATLTAQ
jgi:signal transduction histidine kinase